MFFDFSVKRKYLPKSYYKYLPNVNYEDGETLNILGVFAVTDLDDDEELFVDYWNLYAFDVEKIPDWLCIPPDNLGKFFVKEKYENKFSLGVELTKQLYFPEVVINKFDLEMMIKSGIKELLSPGIVKQIQILEQVNKKSKIEDKAK